MRANTLDAKLLEIDGQGASGGVNDNLLINGAFDIWRRGTSTTVTTGGGAEYLADRFLIYAGTGTASVSASRIVFTESNFPNSIDDVPEYFIRLNQTASATDMPNIQQRIEDVKNAQGKTITVSFVCQSSKAITLQPTVRQNFGSGGSANVDTDASTVNLTTGWNKYSFTVDLPSTSGKTIGTGSFLGIMLRLPTADTYQTDWTNIKVEIGSVVTPFRKRSYAEELALCQRYYYEKSIEDFRIAGNNTSTTVRFQHDHPVQMRAIPTLTKTASAGQNATYSEMAGATVDSCYSGWSADATLSAIGINSLTYNADAEL